MRVLVIDHHFKYDLEALLKANQGRHMVKEVSPLYFYERAQQCFPPAVFFKEGLEEYALPHYEPHRRRWRKHLRRVLEELYCLFPFDVIVAPHYVFFYIYDLPQAAAELGVPFVIAQKETTRSRFFIEQESQVAARYFPFQADLMTVCGPDQVKFCLACGVPQEKLVVTGQPRFDYYCRPERWKSRQDLGLPEPNGRPTILFLTYYLDCAVTNTASYYHPQMWKQIRDETEQVLIPCAIEQGATLLIKPHPQHVPTDLQAMTDRLHRLAGNAWGRQVLLLEPATDVRNLLVHADIVVGFQTTALLEAMVTGKKVIYTFWTNTVLDLQEEILPYHHYEPLLQVARSPEHLRELLTDPDDEVSGEVDAQRRQAFESHLGPLDGHASERFWEVVGRHVNSRTISDHQKERRRQVLAKRRRYCAREMLVAQGRYAFWTSIRHLIGLGGARFERMGSGMNRMTGLLRDRIQECRIVAMGEELDATVLVGRRNVNWRFRAQTYFYRKQQRNSHEECRAGGHSVPVATSEATAEHSDRPKILPKPARHAGVSQSSTTDRGR